MHILLFKKPSTNSFLTNKTLNNTQKESHHVFRCISTFKSYELSYYCELTFFLLSFLFIYLFFNLFFTVQTLSSRSTLRLVYIPQLLAFAVSAKHKWLSLSLWQPLNKQPLLTLACSLLLPQRSTLFLPNCGHVYLIPRRIN